MIRNKSNRSPYVYSNEALSVQFPSEAIKQRKGNFGNTLSYVDSATVTMHLNNVLEGEWYFTVLGHQIDPDEVIVRGQMEINGVVRQQFGGSSITRKQGNGETISIADDLKSAIADCLKKCASSFGVGLYLYGGSSKPASSNTQQHQGNGNGNGL
ncbi:MAG: Rad52/Rad22 family DNA repair protein [Candidatus Hatepunaea meridiana]|nr:Rad52/Rad22 family DNA repair protein [Candidatus Hatepunaea meridiana]